MNATSQVEYESRVRFRYAIVAFLAALLLVASQLLQLSGVHAPVNELTLDLLAANQRRSIDLVGSTFDMLGLIAAGSLLWWLHQISYARRPELRLAVRWLAVVGAGLAAVMAFVYTIVVASRAHEFATTGNQGYPEANHLASGGVVMVLPLLLELGTLLLAMGCIWVSLSTLRVGLVTRLVGYTGVVAGALFLFPIGGLVPVVQGFWLAAVAVTLARRWPQGDPPAWEQGIAVPWPASAGQQARAQAQADARAKRAQRGQRGRKVTDEQVLAAVDSNAPTPDKAAGRRKRKRR
jgi:uncharacterized membrane protein